MQHAQMSWLTVAVVTLSILCTISSISIDDLQILKARSATVYCGQNLSDVLSLVCRGRYNSPSHSIRSYQKRDTDVALKLNLSEVEELFPEESAIVLNKFRKKTRERRGVYNECCQKPCSYEVLRTYCAD